MADAENRAAVERFIEAVRTHDLDALESTLHESVIDVYPQSGERFIGAKNVREILANYPGRDDGFEPALEEVVVEDSRWVMGPGFTAMRLEGAGETFTATGRVRYPDGSVWHVIQIFRVRDGRIRELTSYFAEPFDAPEWRAPYREPIGS